MSITAHTKIKISCRFEEDDCGECELLELSLYT